MATAAVQADESTNQATVSPMDPTQVIEMCQKISRFLVDIPNFLPMTTNKDQLALMKEQLPELQDGIGKVQLALVKLLSGKIDALPAQIELGIRAASNAIVTRVAPPVQSAGQKPTMADVVRRNANVLIPKPVARGEENNHRMNNRELSEMGHRMKEALGPAINEVKLGGLRSTAGNGIVCEFASKDDRDMAKAALEGSGLTAQYQVRIPKKPQIVLKFIPLDATDEDVLGAVGRCAGVDRSTCAIVRKLGRDDRDNRPYLLELSEEDKKALLAKKYVMVGFARCLVEERSMHCFACFGLGQFAAHCKNKSHCGKCASVEHTARDCTSQTIKCFRCVDKKASADVCVNHSAFQTWACPAVKGSLSSNAGKNQNRAQVMH